MARTATPLAPGLLAACAGERLDTTVSPQLDSGIMSSNGGGASRLSGGAGAQGPS